MLLFLIYHASVLYPHVLYTKDIYFREEEEDCVPSSLSEWNQVWCESLDYPNSIYQRDITLSVLLYYTMALYTMALWHSGTPTHYSTALWREKNPPTTTKKLPNQTTNLNDE